MRPVGRGPCGDIIPPRKVEGIEDRLLFDEGGERGQPAPPRKVPRVLETGIVRARGRTRGCDISARHEATVGALVVHDAEGELLQIVGTLGAAGRLRAAWTAGRSRAIKTAMIAMTTSNSIRVKPRDRIRREGKRFMEFTPEENEWNRTSNVGSKTKTTLRKKGDPCRHPFHPHLVGEHAERLMLGLSRSGFGSHRSGMASEIQPNPGKNHGLPAAWGGRRNRGAGSDWLKTEHHSFCWLTYRAGRSCPRPSWQLSSFRLTLPSGHR